MGDALYNQLPHEIPRIYQSPLPHHPIKLVLSLCPRLSHPWARGVDTVLFNPDKKNAPEDVYAGLERPIWVNVGRVAVEKNLTAFLDLDLPGTKVIVGDGPQLAELKRHYSDVLFTGAKFDTELARYFADADVFVFPSKTDTFGLVIIEAMASGLPVAAYPVSGPVDIIPGSKASSKTLATCQAFNANSLKSISRF